MLPPVEVGSQGPTVLRPAQSRHQQVCVSQSSVLATCLPSLTEQLLGVGV